MLINRDVLALFARPAMRCNPRSWLQWFCDPQPQGIALASVEPRAHTRLPVVRYTITFVYSTATVGPAPAWVAS